MKDVELLSPEVSQSEKTQVVDPLQELEKGVEAALETYSNVHRGSGHNSMVTTHLYEKARQIVLDHLGLSTSRYAVVFSTPRRASILQALFGQDNCRCLSSQDVGLPLGVRALAVLKSALPKGIPFQTGGGNARLVSPDKVTWANGAERFEPGTPSIINIMAFAKALQLTKQYGNHAFHGWHSEKLDASEILYNDNLLEHTGLNLLKELRKTLVGCNVLVPTVHGDKPFINFDNGASTPTFKPIWEAVRQTWHQNEQIHEQIIEEVRAVCLKALGASNSGYDVVFTSNTTEATNLVSESLGLIAETEIDPVIMNTLLEHNSNELPWRLAEGYSLIQAPIDTEGFVVINKFETLLAEYNQEGKHGNKRIKLVAISGASNVLGVFNNLQEISRIAHQYGAQILVDAAQLVAHRRVEMENWGIDYLVFSGHKVYAPFGTGVLISRKGLLNFSASEFELIHSSGEENVGGIAALGKSMVLLQRIGMDNIQAEEHRLTTYALKGMAQVSGIRIYGINDTHSAHFVYKGGVIAFSLKNYMPNTIANELAKQSGIGVRSGCHCAHMLIKHMLGIPKPLQRFQHMILFLFPKLSLPGVVRISFGIENTEAEVDTFLQVIDAMSVKLKSGIDMKEKMDRFINKTTERVYNC
ncbi:MAG TPA: aminotransferase class V-fold PLP-dependent enzyme [Bacteroidales bacterium]|nr:aminotransferase class V-fold PLP-dependent enzyme [Bacteroidales bacterium]